MGADRWIKSAAGLLMPNPQLAAPFRFMPCEKCCDDCPSFSDSFVGRETIGDNWEVVSGGWEMIEDEGIKATTSDSTLKLLVTQPDGSSPAVHVSVSAVGKNGGDKARLYADFTASDDSHYAEVEYGTPSQDGYLSIWNSGGQISSRVPVAELSAGKLAGIGMCVSPAKIIATASLQAADGHIISRSVEADNPPHSFSSVDVAIGTGEVNGNVTFSKFKTTEHANDNEECPDCGGCIVCYGLPESILLDFTGFDGVGICPDLTDGPYVASNPIFAENIAIGNCYWVWRFVFTPPLDTFVTAVGILIGNGMHADRMLGAECVIDGLPTNKWVAMPFIEQSRRLAPVVSWCRRLPSFPQCTDANGDYGVADFILNSWVCRGGSVTVEVL